MKVIDLLNKIANGEGVPKTIKLCGNKYQYNEHFKDYKAEDIERYWLLSDFIEFENDLKEEIEIIEDTSKGNEKIEKLDLDDLNILLDKDYNDYMIRHIVHKALVVIKFKINEIIDKINGEENE